MNLVTSYSLERLFNKGCLFVFSPGLSIPGEVPRRHHHPIILHWSHDLPRGTPSPFHNQGGHGTGKTGNLVLTFSRQGKHREFCYNTGKVFETQGKYF